MPYASTTIRAAVVGTISGSLDFVNVFHGELVPPADPSSADALAFAIAVLASYQDNFLPVETINVSLARVDYSTPGLTPAFSGSITASGSGTYAGSAGPPELTECISWQTGVAGRSFRGRTYLPGVKATDINDVGTIAAPQVAALDAAAEAFRTDLEAPGDFHFVVASKVLGVNTRIVNARVGSRVDTQRRRLPRNG